MQDYTGKVAVVTGGAGDIGKAIAKQLLGDGADAFIEVILLAAVEAEVRDEVAEVLIHGSLLGDIDDRERSERRIVQAHKICCVREGS